MVHWWVLVHCGLHLYVFRQRELGTTLVSCAFKQNKWHLALHFPYVNKLT
jgi:hypothetical protein